MFALLFLLLSQVWAAVTVNVQQTGGTDCTADTPVATACSKLSGALLVAGKTANAVTDIVLGASTAYTYDQLTADVKLPLTISGTTSSAATAGTVAAAQTSTFLKFSGANDITLKMLGYTTSSTALFMEAGVDAGKKVTLNDILIKSGLTSLACASSLISVTKGGLDATKLRIEGTASNGFAPVKSLITVAATTTFKLDSTSGVQYVTSNVNGTVLNMVVDKDSDISIAAGFASITATPNDQFGGIIYIEMTGAPTLSDTPASNKWTFTPASTYPTVTSSSRTNAKVVYGTKVFVRSTVADCKKMEYWKGAVSTTTNEFLFEDASEIMDISELGTIPVDGKTGVDADCKTDTTKSCKTLAGAQQYKTYGGNFFGFKLTNTVTEAAVISLSNNWRISSGTLALPQSFNPLFTTGTHKLTLDGTTVSIVQTAETKPDSYACSFATVAGTLDIRSCTFNYKDAAKNAPLSNPLITVTGKLIMTSCTFTSINLADKSLISGKLSDITMKGTAAAPNTFTSIVRTGGATGGAVFSDAGTAFTLTNAKFDQCTSSKATGETEAPKAGAIYASGAYSSFTIKNVEFVAGEGDAVAKGIYFTSTAVTPAHVASLWWGKTGATGLYIRAKAEGETADVDLTTEITVHVNAAKEAPTNACGGASALDAEKKEGPCTKLADAVGDSSVYGTKGATIISIDGELDAQVAVAEIKRYAKVTGSSPIKYTSGGLFKTSGDDCFEFDVDGISVNYYVKGTGSSNAAAAVTGVLFELTGTDATVVLSSVKVGVDATSAEILVGASAVKQSAGKLTMTSCSFTAIPLNNVSLIDPVLASGNFTTTGCTFDGITRAADNGAVFALKLAAGSAITIAGATFKDCKALGGNGGAIYVSGTAGSVTLGADKTAVSFSGCSAAKLATDTANTTGFGGAIYTDAIALITFTNVEFTSFGTAELYGAGLYVTGEKATVAVAKLYKPFLNRDRTAGQFIVHYTETPEGETEAKDFYKNAYELCISAGTAYVSDAGKSGDECSADPEKDKDRETCATILDGLKTFYGSSSAVDVAGSDTPYAETAGYTFVRKVALTASGEKTATAKIALYTTATTSAGVYVIGTSAVSTTVSFTKINYNADDTAAEGQVSVPLFNVVNGDLTLASMAITASATTHGALNTGVLKASSTGKLTLTTVTISSFTLANSPLLEVPFDKLTITPAADASAVTTFKTITRNSGNGAVMQVAVAAGTAFAMEGIVCESCIAKNGNGGAFYIDYQGGDLTFGNQAEEQKKENVLTNFTKCEAQAASQPEPTNTYEEPTAGAGGAIYVKLTKVPSLADSANKFAFKNLVITECKASKEEYGAGIFATSSDATATDIVLKNSTVWGNVASLSDTKIYFEDSEGNTGSTGSNVVIIVVIVVVVVVVVVIIIVVVIVVVCCCCKKE